VAVLPTAFLLGGKKSERWNRRGWYFIQVGIMERDGWKRRLVAWYKPGNLNGGLKMMGQGGQDG